LKLVIFILVFGTFLSGCSSVNVRTDHKPEARVAPSFEQSYTYWWWGIKGEYKVNVREVCQGKPVEQIQAVTTFPDALMNIITLGIYYKRTARVWCKEDE